jgi:hypothetical protein
MNETIYSNKIEEVISKLDDLEKDYKKVLVKKIKKKVLVIGDDITDSELDKFIESNLEKDLVSESTFNVNSSYIQPFEQAVVFSKKTADIYLDNLKRLDELRLHKKDEKMLKKIAYISEWSDELYESISSEGGDVADDFLFLTMGPNKLRIDRKKFKRTFRLWKDTIEDILIAETYLGSGRVSEAVEILRLKNVEDFDAIAALFYYNYRYKLNAMDNFYNHAKKLTKVKVDDAREDLISKYLYALALQHKGHYSKCLSVVNDAILFLEKAITAKSLYADTIIEEAVAVKVPLTEKTNLVYEVHGERISFGLSDLYGLKALAMVHGNKHSESDIKEVIAKGYNINPDADSVCMAYYYSPVTALPNEESLRAKISDKVVKPIIKSTKKVFKNRLDVDKYLSAQVRLRRKIKVDQYHSADLLAYLGSVLNFNTNLSTLYTALANTIRKKSYVDKGYKRFVSGVRKFNLVNFTEFYVDYDTEEAWTKLLESIGVLGLIISGVDTKQPTYEVLL